MIMIIESITQTARLKSHAKAFVAHYNRKITRYFFLQRSGSVRGEDVPFVLGLPISLFPHNYTKQDIKISRVMVQYVANFARTG